MIFCIFEQLACIPLFCSRLFKINLRRRVINDVVGEKNEDQREAQEVAGACA
jgi:hypothetical protein